MNGILIADYVQPTRNFSLAYVALDSLFVIFLVFFLFFTKRKVTGVFYLIGGILYFLVDFLIFYLATKSRAIYYAAGNMGIHEADSLITAMVLFWMSMSYGITNFAFIWLWLSKDKKALPFTALIVVWWICCPLIASFIDGLVPDMLYITTTRSTGKYHGVMGIIMVAGYFFLLIKDILGKEKIPLIRLFVIGFMVQFLWEFILFVFNIRSQNYGDDFMRVFSTMLQDSLVETNLGMPYFYLIHKAVSKKFSDVPVIEKEV